MLFHSVGRTGICLSAGFLVLHGKYLLRDVVVDVVIVVVTASKTFHKSTRYASHMAVTD